MQKKKNQRGRSSQEDSQRDVPSGFHSFIYSFLNLLYYFCFLVMPCGMWDLSSLAQGSNTCSLHREGRVLTRKQK